MASDAETESELGGARAEIFFELAFTVYEEGIWIFRNGGIGGAHAGGSFGLFTSSGSEIFRFWWGDLDDEFGAIMPGEYKIVVEMMSVTATDDGFGGLFGDAWFGFEFTVVPTPGAAAALAGLGVVGARRRRREP